MLKKLCIIFLFCIITLSTTHAWIGLTAENNDVLNISKWNELINGLNEKITQNNLEQWANILLTHSGSDVIINSSFSWSWIETPYITSTVIHYFNATDTQDIVIGWANFIPNSIVTIPWFDWVINSSIITSESKINLNITSGTILWNYNVVISNNGKSNTVWSGNWVWLINVNNLIYINWDDAIWRKYSDWTFAETCNDYKNPTWLYVYWGSIWDGIYWIKPNASPAFKVYCDMTYSSGGRTRYVNIKWNYTLAEWIDCWKWTTIDNANLECFNPNRYNITASNLLNIDWSGTYTYTFVSGTPSYTATSSNGIRKCLGHNEYMTIMKSSTTPLADGSDAQYLRLGANFCKSWRETAGRGWDFMNYDNDGSFGENTASARQATAKVTELYFR